MIDKPDNDYKQTFEFFIKDHGGLDFSEISFRPNAPFTCGFGLVERYREIEGRIIWGFPGIHGAEDRGGNQSIYSPFDFGKTGFYDYKGRGYGSVILLYHRLGFRVLIAHCFPEDIDILRELQMSYAIERETKIANPGDYGFSTGTHTHVEVEAWGYDGEWLETNEVLDWILYAKYEEKALSPLDQGEIIELSSNDGMEYWLDGDQKLKEYQRMCQEKRIIFLNPYKMIYTDGKGRKSTKYSSRALFGM